MRTCDRGPISAPRYPPKARKPALLVHAAIGCVLDHQAVFGDGHLVAVQQEADRGVREQRRHHHHRHHRARGTGQQTRHARHHPLTRATRQGQRAAFVLDLATRQDHQAASWLKIS
jgi:hypothetical protein